MNQKVQKIFFAILMCLLIAAAIVFYVFKDTISLSSIQFYITSFGPYGPLVFIGIYTLSTIFIPSTPFMIAAGLLFGFAWGLLYTVIGGLLSALLLFAISRTLGKSWVEHLITKRYLSTIQSYNRRLEGGALSDLIILRMLPIMPFNVLNVAMGVSKIKTQQYIVGTLVGLAPSNVFAVYAGAFLTTLF